MKRHQTMKTSLAICVFMLLSIGVQGRHIPGHVDEESPATPLASPNQEAFPVAAESLEPVIVSVLPRPEFSASVIPEMIKSVSPSQFAPAKLQPTATRFVQRAMLVTKDNSRPTGETFVEAAPVEQRASTPVEPAIAVSKLSNKGADKALIQAVRASPFRGEQGAQLVSQVLPPSEQPAFKAVHGLESQVDESKRAQFVSGQPVVGQKARKNKKVKPHVAKPVVESNTAAMVPGTQPVESSRVAIEPVSQVVVQETGKQFVSGQVPAVSSPKVSPQLQVVDGGLESNAKVQEPEIFQPVEVKRVHKVKKPHQQVVESFGQEVPVVNQKITTVTKVEPQSFEPIAKAQEPEFVADQPVGVKRVHKVKKPHQQAVESFGQEVPVLSQEIATEPSPVTKVEPQSFQPIAKVQEPEIVQPVEVKRVHKVKKPHQHTLVESVRPTTASGAETQQVAVIAEQAPVTKAQESGPEFVAPRRPVQVGNKVPVAFETAPVRPEITPRPASIESRVTPDQGSAFTQPQQTVSTQSVLVSAQPPAVEQINAEPSIIPVVSSRPVEADAVIRAEKRTKPVSSTKPVLVTGNAAFEASRFEPTTESGNQVDENRIESDVNRAPKVAQVAAGVKVNAVASQEVAPVSQTGHRFANKLNQAPAVFESESPVSFSTQPVDRFAAEEVAFGDRRQQKVAVQELGPRANENRKTVQATPMESSRPADLVSESRVVPEPVMIQKNLDQANSQQQQVLDDAESGSFDQSEQGSAFASQKFVNKKPISPFAATSHVDVQPAVVQETGKQFVSGPVSAVSSQKVRPQLQVVDGGLESNAKVQEPEIVQPVEVKRVHKVKKPQQQVVESFGQEVPVVSQKIDVQPSPVTKVEPQSFQPIANAQEPEFVAAQPVEVKQVHKVKKPHQQVVESFGQEVPVVNQKITTVTKVEPQSFQPIANAQEPEFVASQPVEVKRVHKVKVEERPVTAVQQPSSQFVAPVDEARIETDQSANAEVQDANSQVVEDKVIRPVAFQSVESNAQVSRPTAAATRFESGASKVQPRPVLVSTRPAVSQGQEIGTEFSPAQNKNIKLVAENPGAESFGQPQEVPVVRIRQPVVSSPSVLVSTQPAVDVRPVEADAAVIRAEKPVPSTKPVLVTGSTFGKQVEQKTQVFESQPREFGVESSVNQPSGQQHILKPVVSANPPSSIVGKKGQPIDAHVQSSSTLFSEGQSSQNFVQKPSAKELGSRGQQVLEEVAVKSKKSSKPFVSEVTSVGFGKLDGRNFF